MRRRRSTKTINPLEIRRWEGVVTARRGDVFFSLHLAAASEPIYISEVVHKSMNPDFQSFDLDLCCAPAVGRSNEVVVRVWCDWGTGWRLAVEADVYLGALTYLGRDLESWRRPLPGNAIVFALADGVYTSFWDAAAPAPPPAPPPPEHETVVCPAPAAGRRPR